MDFVVAAVHLIPKDTLLHNQENAGWFLKQGKMQLLLCAGAPSVGGSTVVSCQESSARNVNLSVGPLYMEIKNPSCFVFVPAMLHV